MASALLWLACSEMPQAGDGDLRRKGLESQALQPMASFQWSATGSLATGRQMHTATRLSSGEVLVAGGWGQVGSLASAEVYDPDTGTWSATGAMGTARRRHTATLLFSGNVLVAGGEGGGSSTTNNPYASAELYDPATGTWSPTGSMVTAREEYTATLLLSGKVLVAGGWGPSGYLASAELYDPVAGAWSSTGSMTTARGYHRATLLPSGKVLVTGGYNFFSGGHFASAELYDPATGTWSSAGSMATARESHTATLLPSGKVLVAGGFGPSNQVHASAELYDPATGTWSPTGTMALGHGDHTATLLPSGQVLVAGFNNPSELYDPSTGVWSSAAPLVASRRGHIAALLPSGRVLIAGGWGSGPFMNNAEAYHEFPVVVAPANGSTTSDNTPTYSGTAEVGSTVTLVVDGMAVGTTTAGATGSWSLRPATPLADGVHMVKAMAANAGGLSPESNTNTFMVDSTPPAAPGVVTPANSSITRDNTPAYSGTAEPGSTVTVIVDRAVVGTTTANASGDWIFTQPAMLTESSHTVSAIATDAAGNTSPESKTNTFTVDTTPPAAPRVVTPADSSLTNDSTPTYSGAAEPGSTVKAFVDGSVAGTTMADDSGNWIFTQPAMLAEGSHTVSATATDAAGNTSPESNTNSFTVNTTPPAAPRVVTPANSSLTNDSTPTYRGTADPSSTIIIIADGTPVGTTIASLLGTWSFTPVAPLADGPHAVKARAMNAVGSTSPDSITHVFMVDATPPAVPVILTLTNGSTTSTNQPIYSGTAEPGSTVSVIVDGVALGAIAANASGAWSFPQTAALADGSYAVKAQATDVAGNTSDVSTTTIFTVDTTPPAAPRVIGPANISAIKDKRPTYSGTAEAGSTVTLTVAGAVVGTTKADDSGEWSFQQPTALADGDYTVRAQAADMAGNPGTGSDDIIFTVDTKPPDRPTVIMPADGSTTSNEPTYRGNAEKGSIVTLIVDGKIVGTTKAYDSGEWKFVYSTLPAGSHKVKTWTMDVAGNPSEESKTNTFTVDDTAPVAPLVSDPAESSTINDSTPTYSGSAERDSTITVIVDGVEEGTTTANTSGDWSFTQLTTLADGRHTVKARATDVARNPSADSALRSFMVDTKPPAQRSHYGWRCTTSPSLPASWALLTLALALRKRRLPRP